MISFYKACIILLTILLTIEFVIFVIGISFNIMNPGTKGVSSADFKDWLIITIPTVILLVFVILIKKITLRNLVKSK